MRFLQFLFLFVGVLFAVVSCKSGTTESPETENLNEDTQLILTRAQFETSGMQTGKLMEYDFTDKVLSSGFIEVPPQSQVVISAFVAGHVSYSPLLTGDRVKRGQVVVSLENPDFIQMQQDYADAAHQLAYLQSEYERQKSLAEDNIASQKVFSKAESDYRSMKVKHEGLRKRLQMLTIDPAKVLEGEIVSQINIVSPIDGFVSVQNLTRGMFVSPGEVLLEIIDNSQLHLSLFVYEADAMKIKEGQDIRFRVTQAGSNFYEGTVKRVGKSVEGTERKVSVNGQVANQGALDFVAGMYIDAEIIVNHRKSCGLPNEAVVNEGGQSFVYVLKSSDTDTFVFGKRYVNLGQVREDLTEILCENDSCTVLVKGAFELTEGI